MKGKRSIIKPMLIRIRQKHNISIAETGQQDKWQSAVLTAVCVAGDSAYAHRMMEQVLAFIERDDSVLVVDSSLQII